LHDPLLGLLTFDGALGGYVSGEKVIPFLGGRQCRFVIADYPQDPKPDEVRAAIRNALDASPVILAQAEPYALQYCRDMLALYADGERPAIALENPGDVWSYVQFGDIFYVSRRTENDSEDGIYLSLECNCDWEVEHGLQLVLRNGKAISKLGPFDGHVTTADAYADPKLIGVVYK
jgi:hypothetical protein